MEPYEPPRLLKRRVATAPTLLQPHPRTHRPGEKSDGDVDTLFKHSNAKVVSLVALSDQTFSLESSNRDTIGPWQSHFERTIAIGRLLNYNFLLLDVTLTLHACRLSQALSSSWLRGVSELWKCLATHLPQKPVLVYGRRWEQIHPTDTATGLLANRTCLPKPSW